MDSVTLYPTIKSILWMCHVTPWMTIRVKTRRNGNRIWLDIVTAHVVKPEIYNIGLWWVIFSHNLQSADIFIFLLSVKSELPGFIYLMQRLLACNCVMIYVFILFGQMNNINLSMVHYYYASYYLGWPNTWIIELETTKTILKLKITKPTRIALLIPTFSTLYTSLLVNYCAQSVKRAVQFYLFCFYKILKSYLFLTIIYAMS